MQSKISFFNKAILINNFKRNWIPIIIYTLLLIYKLPFSMLSTINSYRSWEPDITAYNVLLGTISIDTYTGNALLVGIFAVIFSVLSFNYLYSTRGAYMMHAFPLNRKSLYYTNALFTFLGLAMSQLIATVIAIITSLALGAAGVCKWVLILFLYTLLYDIIFTGISAFSCMLSGQLITTVCLYFIINYAAYIVEFCFRLLMAHLSFGLSDFSNNFSNAIFSPISYLAKTGIYVENIYDNQGFLTRVIPSMTGMPAVLIYTAISIVILVLGYLLYKAKHVETANDFLTINILKPVVAIVCSFFAAVALTVLAEDTLNSNDTLEYSQIFIMIMSLTFIIGLIIFFIIQMLIAKSFRVFNVKNLICSVIYIAITAAIFVCVRTDTFGFEKYQPKTDEIEWAGINFNYSMLEYDQDGIDEILALQKDIITAKEDIRAYKNEATPYAEITIKYKLKNGKMITRNYSIHDSDRTALTKQISDELLAFSNNNERIKRCYIAENYNNLTVTSLAHNIPYWDEADKCYETRQTTSKYMSDEDTMKVYKAFLKDIDEGSFTLARYYSDNDDSYDNTEYVNSLEIHLISDEIVSSYDDLFFEYYSGTPYQTNTKNIYPCLNKNMTNTINALMETGLADENDLFLTVEEQNKTYEE